MLINHICIAVRSIGPAAKSFCNMFGYTIKTEKVTNTRQQVNVQFLQKENSLDIKLIEPVDRDSPLCNPLKGGGDGLHHICFMTDNVKKRSLLLKKRSKSLVGAGAGRSF